MGAKGVGNTRTDTHRSCLFESYQTAGCLRSRSQCLLDSLDGVPLLPSDSSVIIGPADTEEVRQGAAKQEDTDSRVHKQTAGSARVEQAGTRQRPLPHAVAACVCFLHKKGLRNRRAVKRCENTERAEFYLLQPTGHDDAKQLLFFCHSSLPKVRSLYSPSPFSKYFHMQ